MEISIVSEQDGRCSEASLVKSTVSVLRGCLGKWGKRRVKIGAGEVCLQEMTAFPLPSPPASKDLIVGGAHCYSHQKIGEDMFLLGSLLTCF